MFRYVSLISLFALLSVAACSETEPQQGLRSAAPDGPKISLSAYRVPHTGHVTMRGEGFTPKQDVRSHLRRPDGTEFPVLPMLTDDRGEITHEIDTLLLAVGVHELWVVDSVTGRTSNSARFEVTRERLEKTP